MDSTLKYMLKSYQDCASYIKNYEELSKTELAEGYCNAEDSGDEFSRDAYFSALMIRYWFKIDLLYESSKSLRVSIEDCVSWVADGLMLAFHYRAWRDPSSSVFGKPTAVEKCLNTCIDTIRLRYYYKSNLQKNKVNYTVSSLEDMMSNQKGTEDSFIDTITDERDEYEEYIKSKSVDEFINYLSSKSKIISAIICDTIAFGNCFNNSNSLSLTKVVSNLSNIEEESYIKYFENKYEVNHDLLKENIDKIKQCNDNKLHRLVSSTLNGLRQNQSLVKEYLCI